MEPPFADKHRINQPPVESEARPFGGSFRLPPRKSLPKFGPLVRAFRAPAPKRLSFASFPSPYPRGRGRCSIKGRPSATRRCLAFSFRRGVYASRKKRARLCLLRAPPCRRRSPPLKKWMVSPGGRCARLRSRSGRRARRSSAARAANWSFSRCPSSKVHFPGSTRRRGALGLGLQVPWWWGGWLSRAFLEWAAASWQSPVVSFWRLRCLLFFFAFTLGEKLLHAFPPFHLLS